MKFFNVKTVDETIAIIEEQFAPIHEPVRISITEAVGRILAEDVYSKEQVPPFARSTVDGYAVQAKTTYGASESMPAFLDITGKIQMGKGAELPLFEGQAQYIPTGGMLPKGADSIVMIEHVEEMGELLNVYRQVAPGENIIRAGDDVGIGDQVIPKGSRLRPQDLGALAAIGVTEVAVYPVPTVGILSTGDEIVPPDKAELSPGEIRDINSVMIGSRLMQLGAKVIYGGIVHDEYGEFLTQAKALFDKVDVLLLSGGSSVGTRDYTVQVLEALGDPGVLVHGVATKPGKPTIVGNSQGKPVIGLPGHPVSALIMLDLLGVPILRQLQGESKDILDRRIRARISRNVPSAVGRSDYIRVRLEERDDELWAVPVFGKSGLVTTMVESDGIMEITANKEGIIEGEQVKIKLFGNAL
ncbi:MULTISPECIES: gephyrin-like molybdotransferase Glp [unclassified Paenibacillus]|uniref:molybdopterin molybdotransferase MoeA n=1 Tax=unclassified Paenibacillus TaxID=185978 RepID=UPI001AE56734|nr:MULTISPECIES: gephyrin-like molybdotransferase Glp [unclassified Paenibacillus]MBP1154941.1 molybdopterin molybdotransferase [Paenibacillus sp. PvP091]MBP1169675.1 molybdopterin molybdotransferase [Paenibacillus sp. PvR098]MBP2440703.1 molybdopterin molybdotransferase [Paenibacillus sp. PvP052]